LANDRDYDVNSLELLYTTVKQIDSLDLVLFNFLVTFLQRSVSRKPGCHCMLWGTHWCHGSLQL